MDFNAEIIAYKINVYEKIRGRYIDIYTVGLINEQLVNECKARGRTVNFPVVPKSVWDIPIIWWNNWEPTPEALELNRQRIQERLNGT